MLRDVLCLELFQCATLNLNVICCGYEFETFAACVPYINKHATFAFSMNPQRENEKFQAKNILLRRQTFSMAVETKKNKNKRRLGDLSG